MITREVLDKTCRELAPRLDATLHAQTGERMGFLVFLFNFGDPGDDSYLSYVSNAQRDDMIKVVEQWLARQKAGLATDPLGPRIRG